jgi:lipoprotein-anchoring transpeptidase ErfK/SrfK
MRLLPRLTLSAAVVLASLSPAGAATNGDNNAPPFFLLPFVPLAQALSAAAPQHAAPQYAALPQAGIAPDESVAAPRQTPDQVGRTTHGVTREIVAFNGRQAPGTIIINTKERRLYYVMSDGKAIRYKVGVGREGFQWSGTQKISNKQEWPDWRPPEEMLKRRPDLPRFMKGGVENPLGARAMYLGGTLYRIHGSNEPETIGRAVSSGCIRMLNADVIDLYQRVKIGTPVVVLR